MKLLEGRAGGQFASLVLHLVFFIIFYLETLESYKCPRCQRWQEVGRENEGQSDISSSTPATRENVITFQRYLSKSRIFQNAIQAHKMFIKKPIHVIIVTLLHSAESSVIPTDVQLSFCSLVLSMKNSS